MTDRERLIVANLINAIRDLQELDKPIRAMGLRNLEAKSDERKAARQIAQTRLSAAIEAAQTLTNR